MRIAVYGLPCSGKTTLLKIVKKQFPQLDQIDGSEKLKELSGTIQERRNLLLHFLLQKGNFIIDGHYEFIRNCTKEIVFTSESDIFDVFFYLYQDSKVILQRMKESEKNQLYIPDSEIPWVEIEKWQQEEISALRAICHSNNKDFYVIDDYKTGFTNFIPFLERILNGFSNIELARKIVSSINFSSSEVYLFDGDKTLASCDTSRSILNIKTSVFDNNFYSGYQFYLFDKEIESQKVSLSETVEKLSQIEYNNEIKVILNKNNSIILSSGQPEIWNRIGKKLEVLTFAGYSISAETKFFVTKFLKERYKVFAYGDSKNDVFMLQEADCGFLVVNKKISSSLKCSETQGLKKIFVSNVNLLSEDNSLCEEERIQIDRLIQITKSDSGISGNRLAQAHYELGKIIARYVSWYEENETTIVCFERSGRFFADGLYSAFNGVFESYNSKFQGFPIIKTKNVILVDGVINSGKTILDSIEKIKKNTKVENIIIATNVINVDALTLFADYKIIAVRKSENKFIGAKIKKQEGNKGPDTSERLFNQL